MSDAAGQKRHLRVEVNLDGLQALQDERDRYREALELIARLGDATFEDRCFAIARGALASQGKEKE